MHFSQLLSILGSAAVVAANTVKFVSLDSIDRTIYFTPSIGHDVIDIVQVKGGEQVVAELPQGWIGNFYAVSKDKENKPGMLGEVSYQGYNGDTFFDVSAIVCPSDHDGVKQIYPAKANFPVSGCEIFPCDNAYYVWDDVQTKVTSETDLICTLGTGPSPLNARDASASVKRDFVLGRF